ncbi:Uncharacterized protein conserved in bacteria [Burkholderia pseudomallei]|uniref:ATP-binding protein n=1 Tax=Burkholderia pseudomallei TaxID=28450 RepID=UPI000F123FA9|nr:ATP-binding protein [Burkholderia pseudomallei]VBC53237.1 Uncharacterized protein conserved in bacteria [Burkholderia pseudomallei]
MKLDRIVLVNWGQLRPGDYDLGNMTLLTGPTGAGKSTMLDGLQTIMTAAYQGNGELDFILEYDERIFKKDKMRELWEKQRAAARAQAELAFGAAEAAQQAEALK